MKKPYLLLKNIFQKPVVIPALFMVLIILISAFSYNEVRRTSFQNSYLENNLQSALTKLQLLESQDQYKINQALEEEVKNIKVTYKDSVVQYEEILDLDSQKVNTTPLKKTFAQVLDFLSEQNYSSANATLKTLKEDIQKEKSKILVPVVSNSQITTSNSSNTPPSAGYSRQSVSALGANYVVDIIAADMGSTRIIVDTASDGDCSNNCPVLSLGDYVARNGAFAGINGSYFCPADYPSCAGKTNSFDTLAMNKNKKYINSDNNVYSTVPAVIFQSGSMRFVGQSLQWGRDTGVDGVLANQPLLISGGNVVFGGSSDPKQGSKGARSFVGNKGNIAYIGVVRNVTVAEMAHVLKSLGMDNALNLDSGGSTALWHQGYKAGPGRNIPNAILFVGK